METLRTNNVIRTPTWRLFRGKWKKEKKKINK